MAVTDDDRTRPPQTAPAATPRRVLLLVAAGLILTSASLRPAVSGLGPLLAEVRSSLGMSATVAGVLTSLPALCFAVFGITAPRLARRRGPAVVILAGSAAIVAGLGLRALAPGTAFFLAASALALAGIAVSNVLLPVVVMRWFPHRVGAMTGFYSMAMVLGASAPAAVVVPLTEALGGSWRAGLGIWAAPAALAMLPWLLALRHRPVRTAAAPAERAAGTGPGGLATDPVEDSTAGSPARSSAPSPTASSARSPTAPAPRPSRRITRSRTAWALAGFFGLQATAAYITMGWLPQIFRDAGVAPATAGQLLAVTMGLGVPLSFILPRAAARMRRQGALAVLLGACGLAGYAGLWLAPVAGAWAWALLLGVSNSAFPLAFTLIGLRSRSSAGVARLSAFAQSTGYLIALPGPLLIGVLQQHTGGWQVPLTLMAALMAVQIAAGVLAGRDRCVEDEH